MGIFKKAGYFQWAFYYMQTHITYLRTEGSGVALVGSRAGHLRNEEHESREDGQPRPPLPCGLEISSEAMSSTAERLCLAETK